MSYQALLFCPDEKTARVVTQVLSELEFSVEPCSEPFAAVKKLMAQHFDAIVVDCDNEQNAALLFKSARNSASNQTSLSVAVVEGQVGVAKAFRLGANLVLTKPIHVEQSKATLRVARGLLRKGQAAKPASTGSVIPDAVTLPSLPAPAPVPFQTGRASAPPPVASASAFEVEAEPTPQPDTVDAALLEYMPDSAPSSFEDSQPSATDSTQSKQYPWQPRKPMAEPMASALRRAAEAAGKTEFENPAGHSAAPQAGAAAAPARAREVTPFESKSVVAARPAPSEPVDQTSQDQFAAAILDAHSPAATVHAPSFASRDDRRNTSAIESSPRGGSKKTLLAAVVLLAVAAAGYFGWTKMQSRQPEPAPHSLAPADAATASPPPAPAASATETQPPVADVVTQTPEQSLSAPGALPSSKPSAAVVGEIPALKTPTAAKPAGAEAAVAPLKVPAESTLPAQPLVVKNDVSPQRQSEAVAPESEQPPTATSIATGSDSSALTGLVNTNAITAQKAAQQTLRISQGVSEGLILKRVQPIYPPQALQMHLEGVVELQASISKTGNITGVKQLSGQAMLGRAAMDAVRQWKYKPYYLNGEPIEIQTQITVNFKLP
jgi:protein TonB